MVPGKDEQGCFLSLYALLTESGLSSNATLFCMPPLLSQLTSDPSLPFAIAFEWSLVHATRVMVVVCEPTLFVLLECLPVKVSLCLRHL